MRAILNYLDANIVDALIAASSILLIYALFRQFRAPPVIAVCFSFLPIGMTWAYQNFQFGYWEMSFA